MPSVMQELQQLQLGRSTLKRVGRRPDSSSTTPQADSRQQRPPAHGEPDGETYEDIGQCYQNCP